MQADPYFIDMVVRYGDLDPQGHMNNTRYFTFIEQARLSYLVHLGLWDGKSFLDLGLIVADAHLAFLTAAKFQETLRVWTRVTRLGTKSLTFEYTLTHLETGQICARGDTVMVAFDYRSEQSIPIPPAWREAISAYEGLSSSTPMA